MKNQKIIRVIEKTKKKTKIIKFLNKKIKKRIKKKITIFKIIK